MGKQKRSRRKSFRENPIGLPSVKDFEAAEFENITNEDRKTALRRVYEKVR